MSEVNPRSLTEFSVTSDTNTELLNQLSIREVTMTESLMSPTLQTRVMVQNARHVGYIKNLDLWANSGLQITARRQILKDFGYNDTFYVENQIFNIANRKPFSHQIDEFDLVATDPFAFRNSARRMSRSWKCVPPHVVVGDALGGCIGIPRQNLILESSTPNRTYFAENIHPYQVVAQQADVALAGGNDPSFLHYMTYENTIGTHRFESLYGMTRKNHIFEFEFNEPGSVGATWENPFNIMAYEFPCDFDIISDLLNGVDDQGVDQNSLLVINPFTGLHSILGADNSQCGMGGQEGDTSFTNKGSAQAEPNCDINVEKHKLKRTARLGLLDADRVATRLTVGFNPNLHVGKMIKATIPNKINETTVQADYGTGYYLISALTHVLKVGGWGTTVIDCVSKSVGYGGSTIGM